MLTQQAVLSRGDRVLWRIWYFEKKFEIFYFVRVKARYKLSLVFRVSTFCSMFKFMLSVGIQLFGLKTISHGNPDFKNSFLRSDFPCEVVFRPKSWIPADNINSNLLKITCWSWKPSWACTWPWPWQNKKFQFFFKISNPPQYPIITWKDSLQRQHMSEKRGVLLLTLIVTHPV